MLIAMLTEVIEECAEKNIDITNYAITMDSWYVSEPLRQELYKARIYQNYCGWEK